MNETIDAFVATEKIAIVGASPNKDNFGLGLMKELKKEGRKVYPVNPKYEEVDGEQTYPTVADLPDGVENVLIVVNPEVAVDIARQCVEAGIKRVWLHQGVGKGSFSTEAVDLLKENGVEYVYGFCPMMFIGKGFHKFHFWLRKNFGKKPAEFSMN
jgi:predicted CoA-binding protein